MESELKRDPLCGAYFLFVKKRRSSRKVLHWDGTGLRPVATRSCQKYYDDSALIMVLSEPAEKAPLVQVSPLADEVLEFAGPVSKLRLMRFDIRRCEVIPTRQEFVRQL